MRTIHVSIEKYDPRWKQDFSDIIHEIMEAAGDLIIAAEHVGSTAVEGMSAKPVIDIDIVVENKPALESVISRLAGIGYIHEGDLGIEGREAFRYEGKPHLKAHHLYACAKDSQELRRHIVFRDYLRAHPEAISEYSRAKEEAAALFPDNIEKYMEFKSPCIERLYALCGLKDG